MEDVFMDVLDYQLTPQELLALEMGTSDNGESITSPGYPHDFASAFVDAYEMRFTSRLENLLSHPEDEEKWPPLSKASLTPKFGFFSEAPCEELIEKGFMPIPENFTSTIFHLRGCVDTGAPRTVCGKLAAQ